MWSTELRSRNLSSPKENATNAAPVSDRNAYTIYSVNLAISPSHCYSIPCRTLYALYAQSLRLNITSIEVGTIPGPESGRCWLPTNNSDSRGSRQVRDKQIWLISRRHGDIWVEQGLQYRHQVWTLVANPGIDKLDNTCGPYNIAPLLKCCIFVELGTCVTFTVGSFPQAYLKLHSN